MRMSDRAPYEAFPDRPKVTLPGGARVAVWFIVNIEEWALERPMPRQVLTPPMGNPLQPDLPNWAWHEYGMRVGFWRILDALQSRGLRATMALNGLIGQGVPQDWATHMIGHEITALYGLDHAQTLAIVLPSLLQQQRAQKRDKLLQYGRRIWQLQHQDEERLIDDAIAHTRAFFEQMGVPTRLADYGINADAVDKLVAALTANGMLKLGEHSDITPEVSRQILQRAV